MKKLNILLGGLALGAAVVLMPSVVKASIIGSEHDFSPGGGAGGFSSMGIATFTYGGSSTTYNNPCQVCHIPHKAAPYSAANAPLWNHAVATNATSKYITYDQAGSASFNALGLGTLTLGSSVACLSCHDGSIAVNQSYGKTSFNGNGGVATNISSFAIETVNPATGKFDGTGNSLTQMHPIGVSYSAAQALDPDLNATPALGSGSTFARMLKGPRQTVECASCHDIHRTIGASASVSHNLIVDLNGGQLCLTCHNK
jgi:predicted CXXCH cytochrome family protein